MDKKNKRRRNSNITINENRAKIKNLSNFELISMAVSGKFPNAGGNLSIWAMSPELATMAISEIKLISKDKKVQNSFIEILSRMIRR
jgi:hypothetical protein